MVTPEEVSSSIRSYYWYRAESTWELLTTLPGPHSVPPRSHFLCLSDHIFFSVVLPIRIPCKYSSWCPQLFVSNFIGSVQIPREWIHLFFFFSCWTVFHGIAILHLFENTWVISFHERLGGQSPWTYQCVCTGTCVNIPSPWGGGDECLSMWLLGSIINEWKNQGKENENSKAKSPQKGAGLTETYSMLLSVIPSLPWVAADFHYSFSNLPCCFLFILKMNIWASLMIFLWWRKSVHVTRNFDHRLGIQGQPV